MLINRVTFDDNFIEMVYSRRMFTRAYRSAGTRVFHTDVWKRIDWKWDQLRTRSHKMCAWLVKFLRAGNRPRSLPLPTTLLSALPRGFDKFYVHVLTVFHTLRYNIEEISRRVQRLYTGNDTVGRVSERNIVRGRL